MKLFTVYDSKAHYYSDPHMARNSAEAIRDFAQEANNHKSKICAYPADYTLFEIGEWDDQSGVVTMHKTHINLGIAQEFKQPNNVTDIRPTAMKP